MNFAKNRTLFSKMPKLGTPSLKQCAFLNGKRVLFSSRKIYEAGNPFFFATLLRSSLFLADKADMIFCIF